MNLKCLFTNIISSKLSTHPPLPALNSTVLLSISLDNYISKNHLKGYKDASISKYLQF